MTERMVNLHIGAVIRLRPELLEGRAKVALSGVESVVLRGHAAGAIPSSLVKTPDGRRLRVFHDEIEPAILSSGD
jgi:hypothetical protein